MATKKDSASRRSRSSSKPVAPENSATYAFEKLIAEKANPTPQHDDRKYLLRLYIAGAGARSSQALAHIHELCEQHLAGRYELEVIDLYQNAALAKGEQIVAAPTLIKKLPLPLRKFIGDMSDENRILVGLDLRAATP